MSGYTRQTKSNNAVIAEAQGHYPIFDVAKKLNLPNRFIFDCCEFAKRNWHHHTRFYNRVDYYKLKEIENWIAGDNSLTDDLPFTLALKQWRSKNKESDEIIYNDVRVEWLEIGGTRTTPVTIQHTENGATVIDYQKSHVKVILRDGQQFNKGKNDYKFRIFDEDREIKLNKRDNIGLRKMNVMELAYEVLKFIRGKDIRATCN